MQASKAGIINSIFQIRKLKFKNFVFPKSES